MKKKQIMFRKLSFLLPLVLLILVLPNTIKAQGSKEPVIYQNWKMIGESSTNYEVSARIVSCSSNSAAQLQIELFNEGSTAQIAHFNLTITNPATNEKIVKEISHYMALGAFIMPTCDSKDDESLRINLPLNWNPTTTIFTLKFIL